VIDLRLTKKKSDIVEIFSITTSHHLRNNQIRYVRTPEYV
jgi:hypothetical protein